MPTTNHSALRAVALLALLSAPPLAARAQVALPGNPAAPNRVEVPATTEPPPKALPPATPDRPASGDEASNFKNLLRLTSPDRFVKAGEAYFDPYGRWIIFQAIPVPAAGAEPDKYYSMYVGRLLRDAANHVIGLDRVLLISPPGSSNTCGYFWPLSSFKVIFGSTLVPPASEHAAGYKRDKGTYEWDFPDEMEICTRTIPVIIEDLLGPATVNSARSAPDANFPLPLIQAPGYDAECSFASDGRNMVYTHVEPGSKNPDIWNYCIPTQKWTPLITSSGYDGGPFFSPDCKYICYRSDRKGDGNLQLFIAELKYSNPPAPEHIPGKPEEEQPQQQPPEIIGVTEERAVTDNEHVNWAPFWSPDSSFLLYTTSQIGHDNYEVFAIEAPVGANAAKKPSDLKKRRLTSSVGFDGLPVFSKDGALMMWTSQRPADDHSLPLAPDDPNAAKKSSSQIWIADVLNAKP